MKNLDYILIPTGGEYHNGVRTQMALDVGFDNSNQKYIISGDAQGRSEIQGFLKGEGISPERIYNAPAVDSVENLAHSFEIAGSSRVGIVSYPMHLNRFKRIFRKLQQKGCMPEGAKLVKIATSYTFRDVVYSILAEAKYLFDMNRNHRNSRAVRWAKAFFNKIMLDS